MADEIEVIYGHKTFRPEMMVHVYVPELTVWEKIIHWMYSIRDALLPPFLLALSFVCFSVSFLSLSKLFH